MRIVVSAVAAILALGVCACGQSTTSPDTSASETTATTAAPAPPTPEQIEDTAWQQATTAAFDSEHDPLNDYLHTYPQGRYAATARQILAGGTETSPATALPSNAARTQACASASRQFIVFFGYNVSELTPEASEVVDALATEAVKPEVQRIIVVGRNDTSGSARASIAVSRARAEAVQHALVAHGIAASKIAAYWTGETDLMVHTENGVKEPLNRVVVATLCQ